MGETAGEIVVDRAFVLAPGQVRAAAAEPGLADALAAGLGAALARRGALGAGPAVDVEVLSAEDRALAADALGRRVQVVRLEVAWQVTGARPRRLVLAGERSYTVLSQDSLGAAGARAEAMETLARDLSEDAVTWLIYGDRR